MSGIEIEGLAPDPAAQFRAQLREFVFTAALLDRDSGGADDVADVIRSYDEILDRLIAHIDIVATAPEPERSELTELGLDFGRMEKQLADMQRHRAGKDSPRPQILRAAILQLSGVSPVRRPSKIEVARDEQRRIFGEDQSPAMVRIRKAARAAAAILREEPAS